MDPAANSLPVFGPIPHPITVFVGQEVKLTFSVSDPDGDAVGACAVSLPVGASLTSPADPTGLQGRCGLPPAGSVLHDYPRNGPGPFTFRWVPSAPTSGLLVWFWATDAKLETSFSSTGITVKADTVGPTITVISPPEGLSTTNRYVGLSASLADNAALKEAILFLDGVVVKTQPLPGLSASFAYSPATALSTTSHTYRLEVKDFSGNLATASRSFTVKSSTSGGTKLPGTTR